MMKERRAFPVTVMMKERRASSRVRSTSNGWHRRRYKPQWCLHRRLLALALVSTGNGLSHIAAAAYRTGGES